MGDVLGEISLPTGRKYLIWYANLLRYYKQIWAGCHMIRLSGVWVWQAIDRFRMTLFASMKTRLVYFNALKYVHGLKFVQKQNNYLGGLFISQRGHSTCT